jgi:hypothetical protein
MFRLTGERFGEVTCATPEFYDHPQVTLVP